MSTSRILLSKRSVLLSKNFNACIFSLSFILKFSSSYNPSFLQFPFLDISFIFLSFFLSYLNSKKEPICTNFSRFFQIFGTYQVFNMFPPHTRELASVWTSKYKQFGRKPKCRLISKTIWKLVLRSGGYRKRSGRADWRSRWQRRQSLRLWRISRMRENFRAKVRGETSKTKKRGKAGV